MDMERKSPKKTIFEMDVPNLGNFQGKRLHHKFELKIPGHASTAQLFLYTFQEKFLSVAKTDFDHISTEDGDDL